MSLEDICGSMYREVMWGIVVGDEQAWGLGAFGVEFVHVVSVYHRGMCCVGEAWSVMWGGRKSEGDKSQRG